MTIKPRPDLTIEAQKRPQFKRQSMIPKSGYRFSEKIMLQENPGVNPIQRFVSARFLNVGATYISNR